MVSIDPLVHQSISVCMPFFKPPLEEKMCIKNLSPELTEKIGLVLRDMEAHPTIVGLMEQAESAVDKSYFLKTAEFLKVQLALSKLSKEGMFSSWSVTSSKTFGRHFFVTPAGEAEERLVWSENQLELGLSI